MTGPLKRDFSDIYLTTFSESAISERQNLWQSSFFSKYLEFFADLNNLAENSAKDFFFSDNCIWLGIVKLSLLRTEYFSLADNVLTSSPKIWHVNKRDVFQLNWLSSDEGISQRWQWCRFQQCLGALTMLLLKGFSETGLFRHLSDYVLRVRNFEITKSMRVISFVKMFKISSRFYKWSNKLRKSYFLWDIGVWISIVKLSLLTTGFFSSTANVFRSSPKI